MEVSGRKRESDDGVNGRREESEGRVETFSGMYTSHLNVCLRRRSQCEIVSRDCFSSLFSSCFTLVSPSPSHTDPQQRHTQIID